MPVIDASVVVDWIAPTSDPTGPARRFLVAVIDRGLPLLAPRLLLEEVGNALLTGVRRGRWTGPAADAAFRHAQGLPVDLVDVPRDVTQAWELSRRYDEHPLYDLMYVAVAQRVGADLITADARLLSRVPLPFIRDLAEVSP